MWGEPGIGMEKEENPPFSRRRAGVHLGPSPAVDLNHLRPMRLRQGGGIVPTASVHHEEFPVPELIGELVQACTDLLRFIERGNDDGDQRHSRNQNRKNGCTRGVRRRFMAWSPSRLKASPSVG